ncbi:MAG: UDP-N-acetylmuramoyl-tripeptide--D-alanyl-D-alanine ligase [bacterium]
MNQEKLNLIHRRFLENPVISTDSRKIVPGSLFFALKGPTFNGNLFAASALEQGASWAIVDEKASVASERCILVDDVLATLQQLAHHHRNLFPVPVIAITGTNGKTTTKELIHAVLSTSYTVAATTGNLNNHIGVPLTLLTMTNETEIAVIEMGANHPGEIDQLCRIANPGYGLITNIGKAHLEGFGGFDGVVRTKSELYRYLAGTGGKIFLNHDDDLLTQLAGTLPAITYGSMPASTSFGSLSADPFVKILIRFENNEKADISSKLYGRYNLYNILAAACIGHHFKVSAGKIVEAIAGYNPSINRSQVKETERNILILDAYNANPSSMKEALVTFGASSYPKKTLILGDMLELGSESDTEHQSILNLIEQMPLHEVYLVGPVFTRLNRKREYLCFQDVELARMWIEHHALTDSAILLKGSRGMKLERLVDLL